jgi:hypothetical protein
MLYKLIIFIGRPSVIFVGFRYHMLVSAAYDSMINSTYELIFNMFDASLFLYKEKQGHLSKF